MRSSDRTIWFDLENAPHVWVLKELQTFLINEGYNVITTARNYSSTLSLCKLLKTDAIEVGKYSGYRNKYLKLVDVVKRSYSLKSYIQGNISKPAIAVSHGSRSQSLACKILGIKNISLDDYEYSYSGFNRFVDYLLTPFPIKPNNWGKYSKKVINYPGLKEDLYLWNSENYLKLSNNYNNEKLLIIFRPESSYSHYSTITSKYLQDVIVEYLCNNPNFHIILYARNNIQEKFISTIFENNKVSYETVGEAINMPALIYNSDAVFSGGGTMSREACILGTPSFNFFGGRLGDVDKYLIASNKMIKINTKDDILKISISKKVSNGLNIIENKAFDFVCKFIQEQIK